MSAIGADGKQNKLMLVSKGARILLVMAAVLLLVSLAIMRECRDAYLTVRPLVSITHLLRSNSGGDAVSYSSKQQQQVAYMPRSFPSCACHHKPKEGCGFLAPVHDLINNPAVIDGQAAPCILQDRWLQPLAPTFSIILTVWNQQHIVEQNIQALLNFTTEPYELIIVFDGCWDKSIEITTAMLARTRLPRDLVHILLIQQATPVWETSANNIGMRAATPGVNFFVLVQDDMQMTWHGWNTLLAFPARLYDDVISVSGRCAHSHDRNGQSVGRCGADIDRPLSVSAETRCTFHVRDTVNRGPLLLNATKMIAMGYLDEVNFVLGDDDHDLHARAWVQHKWVAGWMPLDFTAPLTLGGTRRKNGERDGQNTTLESGYLAARLQRRKKSKESSPVADHDDDREVPAQYNCIASQVWYFNATNTLLSGGHMQL